MSDYQKKKDSVSKQYFEQYLENILPAIRLYDRLVPQHSSGALNVMQTMFLCSVIDHFGKILRVGQLNNDVPLGAGQNKANFIFFIQEYFPPKDSCKGDIIYILFRNGVMHQFFPKASGVFWSSDPHNDALLDEYDSHPRMNNFILSKYVFDALNAIMHKLKNDMMITDVENMYVHLIQNNYGFDDHEKLTALISSYRANGKTLYDSCI